MKKQIYFLHRWPENIWKKTTRQYVSNLQSEEKKVDIVQRFILQPRLYSSVDSRGQWGHFTPQHLPLQDMTVRQDMKLDGHKDEESG